MKKPDNAVLINKLIKDNQFRITRDGLILKWVSSRGAWVPKGRPPSTNIHKKYLIISYDQRRLRVGNIVYQKFIGEIPRGMETSNLDGNPFNNSVGNLILLNSRGSTTGVLGLAEKVQKYVDGGCTCSCAAKRLNLPKKQYLRVRAALILKNSSQ